MKRFDMENSIQISDGLTQTSGDGACLAFDSRYGIMFCAYMPGVQGNYGESRGRIALTYFPAAQPTNARTIEISRGNDEYLPNILGLGNGKVRVFYEKNSRAEGDHFYCYKDYDFPTDTLSAEKVVMLKKEDGSVVPLTLSAQFAYLEAHGYSNHRYVKTEQIGCCGYFKETDGYTYGAAVNFFSEVILYRSPDDCSTVEFFAVYPEPAQYEFEYRFLNGRIYAVYRTDRERDAIAFVSSRDLGKSWTAPVYFKGSIQCRPRMILYHGRVLAAYNRYNGDTGNRPEVQQGRTEVRICWGENDDPDTYEVLALLHSKYGIVNMCVCDILGDLYMAYSTSVLALEYQNGNGKVRGKDAVRYIKLGDLTEDRSQSVEEPKAGREDV